MVNSFTVTTTDGALLQGTHQGRGTPVLLSSGLGGTATFWAQTAAALAALDYRVFCLNQRGINGSSRGNAELTIEQLASDFKLVLDYFELDSAHVVGHSTGGCIAQQLALAAPTRVRSLVLGATWAGPSAYMSELFAFRAQLLQLNSLYYQQQGVYLSYPGSWIWEHPALLQVKQLSSAQQEVIQERINVLLAYDARSELAFLSTPTLVLGTEDDAIVPARLQTELQQLIPKAKIHIWPSGGHFFPVTKHQEYVSKLTNWFSSVQHES